MSSTDKTPSREEVADTLRLAPPFGELELRALKAALAAEEGGGWGDTAYASELRDAIAAGRP